MSENNKKINVGCILAAVGVSISILLSGIFVIGILFFIATPTFLSAAEKAREGAVKANISAAATTITTLLYVEELPADKACTVAIKNLNTSGTPDDTSDDAYSPFDETLPAYSETDAPGVVTIKLSNDNTIEITGYNKEGTILDQKIIDVPEL